MTLRREVTEARRVVVKVGSSSLTTAAGGIDPDRVRSLVDVLAAARERGVEVVTWDGWERLDAHEVALGEAAGRERIKVVPRDHMLRAARA